MRWLLPWVSLAACYSPSLKSGVPCVADKPACPGDQQCVTSGSGSYCEPPGFVPIDGSVAASDATDASSAVDARPDAVGDRDGDGVLDPADNCPDVANADQGNEDGDAFGDVCDPCPTSANNTDDDNDGVGNDCDPHPTVGGDHIAMFVGFHQTIPSTWTVNGTWSVVADDLVTAPATGNTNTIYFPGFSKHETVSAGVVQTALLGNGYRDVAVHDDAASGGFSIECSAIVTSITDTPPNAQLADLYAIPNGNAIDRNAFAWSPGDELVIRLQRIDTTFNCDTNDRTAVTSGSASGTAATDTPSPEVGMRVTSVTAHWHWFMVVTSP